ncbi:MAG: nuclear transport factor 2 family protein [Pseudomonadota bacterium]
MHLTDLERRIARLEDLEAIKQLKARYCDICDADHDPERIVSVFAPDGIWEGAGFGRAQGHAAIRELFQRFQQLISFSQHQVMNPQIRLDGDHASATWYFLGPFTFRKGNQDQWLAIRYEDDYVRIDGEWKLQHLRATVRARRPR